MAKNYTEPDIQLEVSKSYDKDIRKDRSLKVNYEQDDERVSLLKSGSPSVASEYKSPEQRSDFSESSPWKVNFKRFRSMTVSMTVSLIEKESFDRQASALLAGWNVTNLIQGMGILGIPYAVREGGWAAASCIFIVALFCDVTGILLVDCLYDVSRRSGRRKRVRTNYPEVGEAVWPGVGGKVVTVVQTIELYAAAMLYLILLATMFNQITDKYVALTLQEWCVICAVAVLPSVFITRLSVVAWMSMIAVFALMSAIIVTITYCVLHYDQWSLDNIPKFDGSKFPIGFGIVTFSYCAHAVFPGIEGSMKEPSHFNCMLHTSFITSGVVKTLFGVFAVLTFGLATDQVVTINLADNPAFNFAATLLVALNVFFSFPLPLFVVIESFDNFLLKHFPHLGPGTRYHWFWLLLTRTLLVTFALFIALVVPHFGLLMGFVGSFTGTCLSFGFPCIAHLKLKWPYLRWYHILGEFVLIIFGVVAGGFGLIYSGKALIDSFKENPF